MPAEVTENNGNVAIIAIANGERSKSYAKTGARPWRSL